MKPPLFLALDIGTSSVRAALYDSDAALLPETTVRNERILTAAKNGGAEIDAEAAIGQVIDVIEKVLEKNESLIEQIRYVATACFWHSLVGVDEEGRATTPVFTWAETRPAKYVQTLREKLNEKEVHNRTGARFHSSYWTAKLFWLRREMPAVFEKTARWLSFSDFLAERLFSAAATSVSMASGTGIFDIRKNEWDAELLEFLNIEREKLPRIARDDETFQIGEWVAPDGGESLRDPNFQRWMRLSKAEWFPAIGDGAANNLGAGCATRSKAALMVGTSGAMRVAYKGAPPAQIPEGLWCYRIDRQRVIIGGAISDGGGLYRWLKDNLNLPETDEEKLIKREADAHGLTFLPFFAGERSTGYNETAKGAILGLHSATDPVDILQAALEAVAYRFAEIYEQLKTIVEIKEIIASGEALRASTVWTRILTDVLGSQLSLPDAPEASSRGAVLLALEMIGKIESIEKFETPQGREFRFDENRHEIYRKARARHEKFYNLLVNAKEEKP